MSEEERLLFWMLKERSHEQRMQKKTGLPNMSTKTPYTAAH